MMTPLMTLGISIVLVGQGQAQVPGPVGSMAEKLSRSIRREHYRRIGVIPCFIQGEKEKQTWGGSMGPQGVWLADVFARAFEGQARGDFRVADNKRMAEVFRTLRVTPAGLSDPGTLKKIAQEAGGLDALIVGRAVDVREPARPGAVVGKLVRSDLTANLIALPGGTLVSSAFDELPIGPGLAAYRGEPAGSGAYKPLGFEKSIPGEKGANTPNLPAVARAGTPAPAPSPEGGTAPAPAPDIPALDDPRCPFPIRILVDDQPRPFIKVLDPETNRHEFYVNLEPGETYTIAVRNTTGSTVYGVVYIDGLNILGVRRDPDDPRYWNIAPGQDCRFRGWYIGSGSTYQEKPLIVLPASDSIAMQQGSLKEGYSDQIGEIQCIFYGTEGGPAPVGGAKSMMLDRFATGGGESREIQVHEIDGPKRSEDRLLSYVIHYEPMAQIEKRNIVND